MELWKDPPPSSCGHKNLGILREKSSETCHWINLSINKISLSY